MVSSCELYFGVSLLSFPLLMLKQSEKNKVEFKTQKENLRIPSHNFLYIMHAEKVLCRSCNGIPPFQICVTIRFCLKT
jgi:hypothetical protein